MLPYFKISDLVRIALFTSITMFCISGSAQDYEIKNTTINSEEADFSGVFKGRDLVFCSNRAKMNLSFDDDSLTLYYTDLYIAKMKSDGTFGNPEQLKGNVNTDFNEGHVAFNSTGTRMYYTANLKRSISNKFEKVTEYKLGIFIADFENGQWVSKGEFPYNAPTSKYSVAHPSLSANDSTLYFCSNMAGGEGNSDIYKCEWVNGAWSEPVNLGGKINSKGNEFFPFISEFNVLYFSTDGRNDSEGMDIYYSLQDEEGEFQKPVRLNNTINSQFDDFAYQERPGVNQGTFSSNRNGEQDDVFLFNKYINTFKDCHENYSPNFCYRFYDKTLAQLDSLPIRYEWSMGDGQVLIGDSVDYCYKNYGKFHVELNVIDTVTKVVFKKISETDIEISKQDKPFIVTHDTIFATIPFEGKVEFFAFEEFEIDEINWELSDGTKYTGESFMHTFVTPGHHQVKCGIAGKRRKNGVVPMVCVYKVINCVLPEPEAEVKPLLCCDKREYEKISMRTATLATNIESKQLRKVYKLVIAESKLPLKADDVLLTRIDAEIIEIKTDSSYQYAIEEANSWEELLPTYQQLRDEGFTAMYTEDYTRSELASHVTKIIPKNPANAIKLKSPKERALAVAGRIAKSNQNQLISSSTSVSGDGSYTTRVDSSTGIERTYWVDPNGVETEVIEFDSAYVSVVSDFQNSDSTSPVNANELTTENNATNYTKEEISQNIETTYPVNVEQPTSSDSQTAKNYSTVLKDEPSNATSGLTTKEQVSAAGSPGSVINPNKSVGSASKETSAENSKNTSIADNNSQVNKSSAINTGAIQNGDSPKQVEKILYRISLFESEERIPLNDPRFSKIKTAITELSVENHYEYTVMAVPGATDLESLLEELKRNGFTNAQIEKFDANNMQGSVLKTGRYISPKNADKLNIEFSKLSDIKFEYNSSEIKEESFKNLNYIASMLKLEDDFILKVSAHTCAIGGDEYNQKLSDQRASAVVKYFETKGISKERLISQGYGAAKPVQSNESEMGRAANRRVEFIVVFQIEK